MSGALPNAGDELDAVVTAVKPFGVLVETGSGLPGLVHGASAVAGAAVRVRVVEADAVQRRFSAALIG